MSLSSSVTMHEILATNTACNPLHMKLNHKEQKKCLIYIDVQQTSENYNYISVVFQKNWL